MQVRIVENTAVKKAGAILATREGHTIVVIDPNLPPEERYRLLIELLEK